MKGHVRQASLSVPAHVGLPHITGTFIIRPMTLK